MNLKIVNSDSIFVSRFVIFHFSIRTDLLRFFRMYLSRILHLFSFAKTDFFSAIRELRWIFSESPSFSMLGLKGRCIIKEGLRFIMIALWRQPCRNIHKVRVRVLIMHALFPYETQNQLFFIPAYTKEDMFLILEQFFFTKKKQFSIV